MLLLGLVIFFLELFVEAVPVIVFGLGEGVDGGVTAFAFDDGEPDFFVFAFDLGAGFFDCVLIGDGLVWME